MNADFSANISVVRGSTFKVNNMGLLPGRKIDMQKNSVKFN